MISAKPMAMVAMLALAGGAVAQDNTDEQRIAELIERLQNSSTREMAVDELVAMGSPIFRPLLDRLTSEENGIPRDGILEAIGRMRPEAGVLLPQLLNLTPMLDTDELLQLIRTVGDLAPYALAEVRREDVEKKLAPVVLRFYPKASEEDLSSFWTAFQRTQARLGWRASDLETSDLIGLLERNNAPFVNEFAAELLGLRAELSTAALQNLGKMLEDRPARQWDGLVHSACARAILKIASGDDLQELVLAHRTLLTLGTTREQLTSVSFLRQVPMDKTISNLVTRALARAASQTQNLVVARESVTALGILGSSIVDWEAAAHWLSIAIPALERLTKHEDPQIAERAKAALRQVRGERPGEGGAERACVQPSCFSRRSFSERQNREQPT